MPHIIVNKLYWKCTNRLKITAIFYVMHWLGFARHLHITIYISFIFFKATSTYEILFNFLVSNQPRKMCNSFVYPLNIHRKKRLYVRRSSLILCN